MSFVFLEDIRLTATIRFGQVGQTQCSFFIRRLLRQPFGLLSLFSKKLCFLQELRRRKKVTSVQLYRL